MNNIYSFLIIFIVSILGCTPDVIQEDKATKKIDSLDLNIFTKSGEKKYSIKSPSSVYDSINDKFQFKKTTINIFYGGEIKHVINSDESTLSDNNNFLELKGNVKLKTINQDDDNLYADNFIWNIDETNYLLTGNVRFENKNVLLTSGKAMMGSDNIIEFFYPVKYLIKDESNKSKYETNSENAYYDVKKESLSFRSSEKKVRSKIYF